MDDPLVPFDLSRMLFGDAPPLFLAEIAVRVVVIYVYALVMIRWVGARGIAQMSAIEFLLVVALGSAVGDPMFQPEVPLVHCMAVITAVVVFNKVLDVVQNRHRRVENVISGTTVRLVAEGVMDPDAMATAHLSREELFTALRGHGVVSLGAVRVAYLEPSGDITVFLLDEPRPGLPVEPPWDVEPPHLMDREEVADGQEVACARCGMTGQGRTCGACGNEAWIAVRQGA